MLDARLDVYLPGELQPSVDGPTMVCKLATTFKKDIPPIEKILHQARSVSQAGVDPVNTSKYQSPIQRADSQCELDNLGKQLFPNEALNPAVSPSASVLAPVKATALKVPIMIMLLSTETLATTPLFQNRQNGGINKIKNYSGKQMVSAELLLGQSFSFFDC